MVVDDVVLALEYVDVDKVVLDELDNEVDAKDENDFGLWFVLSVPGKPVKTRALVKRISMRGEVGRFIF